MLTDEYANCNYLFFYFKPFGFCCFYLNFGEGVFHFFNMFPIIQVFKSVTKIKEKKTIMSCLALIFFNLLIKEEKCKKNLLFIASYS